MLADGFWDDRNKAKKVTRQLSSLKQLISQFDALEIKLEEMELCLSLLQEEKEQSLFNEAKQLQRDIDSELGALKLQVLLSGEYDSYDAILSLHPGAGGTESQDWADILFRMYLRYFEKKNWQADILDLLPGDEAGIKSAVILVKGHYVYGTLKGEKGIHRLVRISPFDSSGRRHTSFASVDVIPDVEEDIDIELDEADLKFETFRASGAGGQHVNKTDSAVRLTHLPTNIVVQCQNERSQHSNKMTALRILKSKILELEISRQEEKIDSIRGEQKDIAWGNQIRSYVFHPYNMVKDLRTGEETGNIQSVMDGNLEPFVESYLQWQAGRSDKDA